MTMRRSVDVTAPPTSGISEREPNEVILKTPRRILMNARRASGVTFEPLRSGPFAFVPLSSAISSASSSTSTGSCVDTAGLTRTERARQFAADNLLGNPRRTGARATVTTARMGTGRAGARKLARPMQTGAKLDMARLSPPLGPCLDDRLPRNFQTRFLNGF